MQRKYGKATPAMSSGEQTISRKIEQERASGDLVVKRRAIFGLVGPKLKRVQILEAQHAILAIDLNGRFPNCCVSWAHFATFSGDRYQVANAISLLPRVARLGCRK